MTPAEALVQALRSIGAGGGGCEFEPYEPGDPDHHGPEFSTAILAALAALGFTVARTQDAADGEALRLLEKALPDDSWYGPTLNRRRFGEYIAEAATLRARGRYIHGEALTIAAAADACRAAIEATR